MSLWGYAKSTTRSYVNGKGGKDRRTILPDTLIANLRSYYRKASPQL